MSVKFTFFILTFKNNMCKLVLESRGNIVRKHKQKNVLIGLLIAAVLMMSVGYAALASQLQIGGISNIAGNFKVKFTSITEGIATGTATNKTPATISDTSATFDVEFTSPGDSMTYEIVVKNVGNLVAELDSIVGLPSESSTDPIKYTVTGVSEGDVLRPNETVTVTVKAEYDSSITTQPEDEDLSKQLSVTLNYVQSIES